jgi:hypothetical protein
MLRAFLTFACLTGLLGAIPIAEKTKGLDKLPGFVTLYWDAKSGKLYLELSRLNQELLYVSSLPAGLGSNDIGLDRGQLSSERVVQFERTGNKVLLIQQNYDYRALSNDADERQAVADSFARSALAGFTIEAEDEGGSVLVDATSFLLRDAHNVTGRIRQAQQGSCRLDAARSVFYLPRTKAFPKNSEVEATLTFACDNPGNYVREVAPDPESITVRQHHSFIELPDPGYQPRVFDPRSGYFALSYMDYATPVDQPIRKRFITRHRVSRDKPLVYYLDRGAPEPIRSALLEGGNWWKDAFAAAGFPNGFRVEVLPEGADPMDVRYNLIQWVHRSTRGWSYGASVTDPRTGEILKGHVTLGSLRVRQDYLIAEGLLSPHDGSDKAKRALEMSLLRLKQLSAHEIGHTLGLAHNFAASVSERASVMDYPHPLALLNDDGTVDLQQAYTKGIGEWDKTAIRYGYTIFPAGTNEKAALSRILEESQKQGIIFIADADSADGGAHPSTHVWDNGKSAVDELNRVMNVRAKALERFGERAIKPGDPMATIEEVLVPLYLAHRYQVAAAAKTLGGLNYTYALRGDGQVVTGLVPPDAQAKALDALLATLKPEALTLPERIIRLIPPRPIGYPRTRELFARRTGITFDPVGAAEAAANLTIGQILHPDRVARLAEYHARDPQQPSPSAVIQRLLQSTVLAKSPAGLEGQVKQAVDQVVLYHLMALTANERASRAARSAAHDALQSLPASGPWLKQFLEDPSKVTLSKPLDPPPGAPI